MDYFSSIPQPGCLARQSLNAISLCSSDHLELEPKALCDLTLAYLSNMPLNKGTFLSLPVVQTNQVYTSADTPCHLCICSYCLL